MGSGHGKAFAAEEVEWHADRRFDGPAMVAEHRLQECPDDIRSPAMEHAHGVLVEKRLEQRPTGPPVARIAADGGRQGTQSVHGPVIRHFCLEYRCELAEIVQRHDRRNRATHQFVGPAQIRADHMDEGRPDDQEPVCDCRYIE